MSNSLAPLPRCPVGGSEPGHTLFFTILLSTNASTTSGLKNNPPLIRNLTKKVVVVLVRRQARSEVSRGGFATRARVTLRLRPQGAIMATCTGQRVRSRERRLRHTHTHTRACAHTRTRHAHEDTHSAHTRALLFMKTSGTGGACGGRFVPGDAQRA